ncbi:transposase [Bacteroides cellulosilyticus]|nr:transposase [Bacteroides cellulosilyticus]
MAIRKLYYNFIVSKHKELQTKIAIITESKVTIFFCMADDFCKFYDAMVEKYIRLYKLS